MPKGFYVKQPQFTVTELEKDLYVATACGVIGYHVAKMLFKECDYPDNEKDRICHIILVATGAAFFGLFNSFTFPVALVGITTYGAVKGLQWGWEWGQSKFQSTENLSCKCKYKNFYKNEKFE